MSDIKISAVIPTFNRGHIIARAIESVLAQSYAPTEIIVVDDGSTDDTAAQLARFGERVRYLYKTNGGSAAARHHGILAATSPWIALLDSDDSWTPKHLSCIAEAIAATDGAARFYFADTLRSSEENGRRHWAIADFEIAGPFQLVDDAADWVMKPRQPMMLQATVFRKDAYVASGGFWSPLRYRDDTHLYLKLGIGGAACAVNLIGCRMNDDDQQNRLSSNYNHTKRGYEMQILMNQELLSRSLRLKPAHQQELKRRLADAHRAVARHSWRERRLVAMCKHVAQSVVIQPSSIANSVGRAIRRLNG